MTQEHYTKLATSAQTKANATSAALTKARSQGNTVNLINLKLKLLYQQSVANFFNKKAMPR